MELTATDLGRELIAVAAEQLQLGHSTTIMLAGRDKGLSVNRVDTLGNLAVLELSGFAEVLIWHVALSSVIAIVDSGG